VRQSRLRFDRRTAASDRPIGDSGRAALAARHVSIYMMK
jgi:hypothetical protein